MNRITADIDTKNKLILLLSIIKAILKIKKITLIQITPSYKKGYHIIVHSNYKYSKKDIFKLRSFILDDKNRIKLDKQRKIGTQTLFSIKEKI